MQFHQLNMYAVFKIESEPHSLFKKTEMNRWDGAINAYKIKDRFNESMFKPVTFSKDYDVIEVKVEEGSD